MNIDGKKVIGYPDTGWTIIRSSVECKTVAVLSASFINAFFLSNSLIFFHLQRLRKLPQHNKQATNNINVDNIV